MKDFQAILEAYVVRLGQLMPRKYFLQVCDYAGSENKPQKQRLKVYWAYFKQARTERIQFWRSLWTFPRPSLTMHYGLKSQLYFSKKGSKYHYAKDEVFNDLGKDCSIFGFIEIDQTTR